MNICKTWTAVFVVYGCVLLTPALSQSGDMNSRDQLVTVPSVTVTMGGVRITNSIVELRCTIRNDSEHDVWIYHCGLDSRFYRRRTNSTLFMDIDGETLIVLRRMNVPDHGFTDILLPPFATYDRLGPAESRPEVLVIGLPVNVESSFFPQGFVDVLDGNDITVRQLAFEIGYYTTEDLQCSKPHLSGHASVRISESGDEVYVCDLPHDSLWQKERVVRVAIDGLRLSLREWLDFGFDPGPTPLQEIAGAFHSLVVGFGVSSSQQADSSACKDQWKLPEKFEDLFYSFSVDLHEYDYAQRLFNVDETLWSDEVRAIADVYRQFAQGQLTLEALSRALDRLGVPSHRMKILHDIESRQRTADHSDIRDSDQY